MGRKRGFSFSWKRAIGLSGAKNRVSRRIGIPLTRSGRQRKMGRAAGCFVATAVYGDIDCSEVRFLRIFRDRILLKSFIGRFMTQFYYIVGPTLALIVKRNQFLRRWTIRFLNELITFIEKYSDIKKER